jgi:hypothetical protein
MAELPVQDRATGQLAQRGQVGPDARAVSPLARAACTSDSAVTPSRPVPVMTRSSSSGTYRPK